MKVLLLGSGGREHALAWKIAQSKSLDKLYCMPGNPGVGALATCIPGGVTDFEKIAAAVKENDIDMVVVGPEVPLVAGVRDYLLSQFPQLLVVGPDKFGAQLEGSKDFAKAFMSKYAIPTAAYSTFDSSTIEDSYKFLEGLKPPYVLKADGLAAGKGVVILDSLEEAKAEIAEMFSGKFGNAGAKVVIEQFLSGIEVSVFVLTDGESYMILPEAKDYKRIGVGDQGLNTGGMGAVSPVPFADEVFMSKVEERIVKPTIAGIKAEGMDYKGFVFIGLMNCGGDPYVIEYNVRMGDPETEAVMTRIDSDLLEHLTAAAQGKLFTQQIEISKESAVTVVMVSGGYPEDYKSGYQIKGLEIESDCKVFHAGTKLADGEVVTAGGRVLAVTANASSVAEAQQKAFERVSQIEYTDNYHRCDIADDILRIING